MQAILDMTRNISNLNGDDIFLKITSQKGFLELIEKLNKQQLQEGLNSDSNIIGLYSNRTERINPDKKAGTPYTLEDTGEFYDSFKVTADGEGVNIDAQRRFKTKNIFEKYGIDILGLTEENHNEIIEYLIPIIQEAILEAVFKDV